MFHVEQFVPGKRLAGAWLTTSATPDTAASIRADTHEQLEQEQVCHSHSNAPRFHS